MSSAPGAMTSPRTKIRDSSRLRTRTRSPLANKILPGFTPLRVSSGKLISVDRFFRVRTMEERSAAPVKPPARLIARQRHGDVVHGLQSRLIDLAIDIDALVPIGLHTNSDLRVAHVLGQQACQAVTNLVLRQPRDFDGSYHRELDGAIVVDV